MKYNGFEVPDKEIDKLQETLEISIAEACELWLADNGKIVNEEQEQANKHAETSPRRYEQGTLPRKNNGKIVNEEQEQANKHAETSPRRYEQGTLPRKKTKKERKVNKDKGDLLKTMAIALIEKHNCTEMEQKTETELHFEYKNKRYTVKLTEHRPKK